MSYAISKQMYLQDFQGIKTITENNTEVAACNITAWYPNTVAKYVKLHVTSSNGNPSATVQMFGCAQDKGKTNNCLLIQCDSGKMTLSFTYRKSHFVISVISAFYVTFLVKVCCQSRKCSCLYQARLLQLPDVWHVHETI